MYSSKHEKFEQNMWSDQKEKKWATLEQGRGRGAS
jgi:hypothetical protein